VTREFGQSGGEKKGVCVPVQYRINSEGADEENNCERFVSGGRNEKNACHSCPYFSSKLNKEQTVKNEQYLDFLADSTIEKYLETQAGFVPKKSEITPLEFDGIVHLKTLFIGFERTLRIESMKTPKM
jgi:hypothetical protein